jgi:hypothetical protein
MSRALGNVYTTNGTFYSWLSKTNDVVDAFTETVTLKANTAGDMTIGNGFITGVFGANTLAATTLKGGNVQSNAIITIASNTNIGNSSIQVTTLQNNIAHTKVTSYTTTNTDIQLFDSFSGSDYRAGKYMLSLKETDSNYFQTTEIMILHDGTNAMTTEYATIISSVTLGIFTANVDGTTVRLYVQPTTSNNVIKYHRTLIAA